jgi:hypothetical protein
VLRVLCGVAQGSGAVRSLAYWIWVIRLLHAGNCGEQRIGFGAARVFAGDFVRQVVANRPKYKGFGDEIKRCAMCIEVPNKRLGRIGPCPCYQCLVQTAA